MRTKFLLVALLTLIISACGGGGGDSPPANNPTTNPDSGTTTGAGSKSSYFPLTVGSVWTYRMINQPTTFVDKQIMTDGTVKTVVSNQTGPPSYTTFSIQPNNAIHLTKISVDGVINGTMVTTTSDYNPGAIVFPSSTSASTVESTSYSLTVTMNNSPGTPVSKSTSVIVTGTETITTPAGTFDTVKIQSVTNSGTSVYSWYAAGVGLVKTTDMELVSCTII